VGGFSQADSSIRCVAEGRWGLGGAVKALIACGRTSPSNLGVLWGSAVTGRAEAGGLAGDKISLRLLQEPGAFRPLDEGVHPPRERPLGDV